MCPSNIDFPFDILQLILISHLTFYNLPMIVVNIFSNVRGMKKKKNVQVHVFTWQYQGYDNTKKSKTVDITLSKAYSNIFQLLFYGAKCFFTFFLLPSNGFV